MADRIEQEGLRAAWRALSGGQASGWRTIPIGSAGGLRVLAGRRQPGDEEVVLFGLQKSRLPKHEAFPVARGFELVRATPVAGEVDTEWLALCRRSQGGIELFTLMVMDILGALHGLGQPGESAATSTLLTRIRAWQKFMEKGKDGVLSAEAEVGLAGELSVLTDLFDAGLPVDRALEAWLGPLDGLQDFALGKGAIEVKSTVAAAGFPAWVSELSQLDDGLVHPIFIAAVRMAISEVGLTLPEIVNAVRQRIAGSPGEAAVFEARLLHADYDDRWMDGYFRRFVPVGTRLIRVDDTFPRLTPSTVPGAVRRAMYEIELDQVTSDAVELRDALIELGVI
jgi:Putative  PD-(D/E)XK family member, (DUF4420)